MGGRFRAASGAQEVAGYRNIEPAIGFGSDAINRLKLINSEINIGEVLDSVKSSFRAMAAKRSSPRPAVTRASSTEPAVDDVSSDESRARQEAGVEATKMAGGVKEIKEAASSPRRPGRPAGSVRGPEQREKLLEAALSLFARQGIVDTTLGAIAREAGVTSAMVHYYFKSRDQLLDVLIDERVLPMRIAIGDAFRDNLDDPVAAIVAIAQRLIDTSRARPWFAPVWVREVISDGGLLKQRMNARFGDEHQRATIACIERWQREGRLNPDLEPTLVFMSLFGLAILPFATATAFRDDPLRQHLSADDIAKHAIAMLVSGLSVPGERGAKA
jgi:AcrR family transcriptional regulator